MKHSIFFILALFCTSTHATTVSYVTTPIDDHTIDLAVTLTPDEHDYFYYDYFNFSVDHPGIQLSPYKKSIEPVTQYSSTFKETKKIVNKKVTLSTIAHRDTDLPISQAYLHFSYYAHAQHHIEEYVFPFSIGPASLQHTIDATESTVNTCPKKSTSLVYTGTSPVSNPLHQSMSHYCYSLTACAEQLDPPTATLLFTLLCAILLGQTARTTSVKGYRLRYLLAIPCFYVLATVAHPANLLYLLALLSAITGIVCIYKSDRTCCAPWRTLKSMLGIGLLAGALIICCYGYKMSRSHPAGVLPALDR